MHNVMGRHQRLNVFLLLILLLSGCDGSNWTASNITESKKRGDAIVAALTPYLKEHGQYPERLDQLVPKYIPEIKPPTAGEGRWDYVLNNDPTLSSLRFKEPGPPPYKQYWFSFTEQCWRYNDGSF